MADPHRPVDLLAAALIAVAAAVASGGQDVPKAGAPADLWVVLSPARASATSGATLAPQPDGSLLAQGPATEKDGYTLEFETLPKGVTALRIEALADPSLPVSGPGRSGNGNFVLTELRATTGPKGSKRPRSVAFVNASASFSQEGLPASAAIDGVPTTGWAIHPKAGVDHHLVVETRSDVQLESGVLTLELEFQNGSQNTIGRLRVAATSAPRPVRAELPADQVQWSEIQGRINHAIDQGCEWLLMQQLLDGSFDVDQATYRNGATALVTYALLKSGVPKGHPAIVRALEFMKGGAPRETYTLGCQLLALATLNDPSVEPWMKQLADVLAQNQLPNGAFSYGHSGGFDDSNSQYGALGLRAAAMHGHRVEPEVWEKLAGFVMSQSEELGGGAYAPLGFKYNGGKVTGSMTAAGAGILAICDEQLKGRNTKLGNLSGLARRGGEWLGQNFAVDTNPRSSGEWLYYYLYGVERVGALLQTEELGGHRWYREGARFLVERQEGDGRWSWAGNHPLCNTSWALLFLVRATAASSGKSTRSVKTYGGDDPAQPMSIRASGDTPLTFWISSFGDAELASYEWPGESKRGLRVKQVEWIGSGFADNPDEVALARIDKDASQPCGRERFGGQYFFPLPGKYSIFARAHLLVPPAVAGAPSGEFVLESPMLQVRIDEATDAELLRYAGDSTRNLLLGQKLTITASSTINGDWDGRHLCNGLLSRGWASGDHDPKPKLSIELEKPVRANHLQITLAKISDDRPSRIRKLLVTFNGKGPPVELQIELAPNRKSKLKLPQPIVVRRIDLEVTEVTAADAPLKSVGFAEVEVQMESGGKR